MMRLKDKVVIVTGAGNGIGQVIAEECAREGAKVVVSSRRAVNGQPVADGIVKAKGEAIFVKCDISLEEEVKIMVDTAIKTYGKIDVLINNAGVNFVKKFVDCKPEDWDRVIDNDLRGTYLCTWYTIPHMLKNGAGSIINITSVHTLQCMAGAAPYDAAKWAMVGFTKSLAVEFGANNIRANALSPGIIDTQIWTDIQEAAADPVACREYWNSNIPMERVGRSIEIAKAAVFLASDDSAYTTGANLLVDGGMTSQLLSREPFDSTSLEGQKRG
jgi:NAD(P)-dependent dehydrogenase (short-subunit alcohol dehydrogenase family)